MSSGSARAATTSIGDDLDRERLGHRHIGAVGDFDREVDEGGIGRRLPQRPHEIRPVELTGTGLPSIGERVSVPIAGLDPQLDDVARLDHDRVADAW